MYSYSGGGGAAPGAIDYSSLYKSLFGGMGQAASPYNPQADMQAAKEKRFWAEQNLAHDNNFVNAVQDNQDFYNAGDDLKFAQTQATADQAQQAQLNQQKMQLMAQMMQQRNNLRYQYGI